MDHKLKVLLITNLFPNNKEPNRGIFIKQEVLELSKLCEIRVVAPIPWFPSNIKVFSNWSKNSHISKEEIIEGVKVYHPRWLVTPKMLRFLYGFMLFFSITPKINKIKEIFPFDVIYSPWIFPDGFASVLLGKKLGIPVVLHALGCDINHYTKSFLRRIVISWCLRKADKIISVSNALSEKILNLGIPLDKIQVIPNGIDNTFFKPLDKNECRNKTGLPLDKDIILFIGSLEKVKGINYLLSAYRKLVRKNGDKIRLVVIGKGSLENKVKKSVSKLSLQSLVIFPGEVKHHEIPLWINASDVFCLPSIREGMPNVVLEALACNKPVVATKVGGMPEIISNEKSGILVKSNDANLLAKALSKVLDEKVKYQNEAVRTPILSWRENAELIYKVLEITSSSKQGSIKILYHHRTQAKGAEGVHIREIIRSFREMGNEVYVISPQGVDVSNDEVVTGKNHKYKILAKIFVLLSKYSPQIAFELIEIAYNFIALRRIKKVLNTHKISFIYERNAFFCWAGTFLAKKSKIPIILEVNEISGIERVRGLVLKSIAKKIDKINFDRADIIIVVSKFLKDNITNMGVDPNKIHIIPNGVNLVIFDRNINHISKALKNNLGLSNNFILGFVGGLVKWHNFSFLFDVLANVIKDDAVVGISLILVGDGPMRDELKIIVREKKLDKYIIFTGNINHKDVPKYIGLMDICIIPHSNDYRSPIKMFEYMAMGKPVVAPMTEPISSIISNGVNGMLFKEEDGISLKNCILDLVNNENKRKSIGEEARRCIEKKYQWRLNTEKIIGIYKVLNYKC